MKSPPVAKRRSRRGQTAYLRVPVQSLARPAFPKALFPALPSPQTPPSQPPLRASSRSLKAPKRRAANPKVRARARRRTRARGKPSFQKQVLNSTIHSKRHHRWKKLANTMSRPKLQQLPILAPCTATHRQRLHQRLPPLRMSPNPPLTATDSEFCPSRYRLRHSQHSISTTHPMLRQRTHRVMRAQRPRDRPPAWASHQLSGLAKKPSRRRALL